MKNYPEKKHQRDFMAKINKLLNEYNETYPEEGNALVEIEFGDGTIVESDLDRFLKN